MSDYIERRISPEIRAVGNRLTGYAALFDSLSEDLGGFKEKIERGAFADSIANGDVRALFNHDTSAVLGRTTAGTLRLAEDKKGLKFELDLPNTTPGRDVKESVRRGDVTACSFGFVTLEEGWERGDKTGNDIRILKKVRLLEVSPCVFPAYPATSVAVRSFEAWRSQRPSTSPRPSPPDGRVVLTGRELREAIRWNLTEAHATAAHEAGHLVVMLSEMVSVRGARLLWREDTNGKFTAAAGDVTHGRSSGATAASYLVGMLAEDPNGIGWNPARSSRSDLSAVRQLAPRVEDVWQAKKTAKRALKTYRRAYVAIYSRLLREGEVSGEWCRRVFNDECARLKRLGRAA